MHRRRWKLAKSHFSTFQHLSSFKMKNVKKYGFAISDFLLKLCLFSSLSLFFRLSRVSEFWKSKIKKNEKLKVSIRENGRRRKSGRCHEGSPLLIGRWKKLSFGVRDYSDLLRNRSLLPIIAIWNLISEIWNNRVFRRNLIVLDKILAKVAIEEFLIKIDLIRFFIFLLIFGLR